MRITTREQGYTTKTPDIIGRQNDGHIEGQKTPGETFAALAVPLDLILPLLELFCFSGHVCKFLQGDPDFRGLESRCQQIAFVKDLAESGDNVPVSINALTRAFNCRRFHVQAALAHGIDEPRQQRKQIALDKIVNNRSSTGFNRTQNKKHHSLEKKSGIIVQLNSRSNLLEDG
jgi:hypothetical protein